MIGNLSKYVDLPQMYCDALSRYLNPGIVPLLNFLPAVVFQLVLNYIMSAECLFFDHFAGLTVMESLLELHLASLFLANLCIDEMVQGLYAQSPVLQFWEWVTLTPVSMDYLIPDLWLWEKCHLCLDQNQNCVSRIHMRITMLNLLRCRVCLLEVETGLKISNIFQSGFFQKCKFFLYTIFKIVEVKVQVLNILRIV